MRLTRSDALVLVRGLRDFIIMRRNRHGNDGKR
jgi:hypothetical protein